MKFRADWIGWIGLWIGQNSCLIYAQSVVLAEKNILWIGWIGLSRARICAPTRACRRAPARARLRPHDLHDPHNPLIDL